MRVSVHIWPLVSIIIPKQSIINEPWDAYLSEPGQIPPPLLLGWGCHGDRSIDIGGEWERERESERRGCWGEVKKRRHQFEDVGALSFRCLFVFRLSIIHQCRRTLAEGAVHELFSITFLSGGIWAVIHRERIDTRVTFAGGKKWLHVWCRRGLIIQGECAWLRWFGRLCSLGPLCRCSVQIRNANNILSSLLIRWRSNELFAKAEPISAVESRATPSVFCPLPAFFSSRSSGDSSSVCSPADTREWPLSPPQSSDTRSLAGHLCWLDDL